MSEDPDKERRTGADRREVKDRRSGGRKSDRREEERRQGGSDDRP